MYSPLYFSQTRGSASAAEPPGGSSPSLSLLDAMAAALLLLLAAERLRFGTRPEELAQPATARFFFFWFFFVGGLWLGAQERGRVPYSSFFPRLVAPPPPSPPCRSTCSATYALPTTRCA